MIKDWLEKNLQEPFFKAEMVKAQINVAGDTDKKMGSVRVIAVFGAVYMVFCVYWLAIYLAG